MTRSKMEEIAARAARLAETVPDELGTTYVDYYLEYMDQLQTGDSQCLRGWLCQQIRNGVREAMGILELWIRADGSRAKKEARTAATVAGPVTKNITPLL